MARLIMRRGPNTGTVFVLEGDVITIGRGSRNDIVIRDNEVSREHCRLTLVVDHYEILDLHSSNGTYVNGMPATNPLPLASGALIELGDSVTLVFDGNGVPPATSGGNRASQQQASVTAPPARYSLTMIAGPEKGRVFELTRPTVSIGRDLSNDIIIQDPEVSRFHARLRCDGPVYVIEDLDSTNGTSLDDASVTAPTTLTDGAVICLGTDVRLLVETDAKIPAGDAVMKAPLAPQELNPFYEDTASGPVVVPPAQKTPQEPEYAPPEISLEDHIVVVYAREDWNRFVSTLVQSLRDARLNVWVDQDLNYGDAVWRAAMEKALRECWLMVVVLSPRSHPLNYIRLSYRTFLNLKKPVIPIVYEPAMTLPLELAKHRLIIHDRRNPHRSVQKLIFEIKELRRLLHP